MDWCKRRRWIGAKDGDSWAGFLINKRLKASLLTKPREFVTGVNLSTGSGSLGLISFYIKPAESEVALNQLKDLLNVTRHQLPKILAIGDSNGHSPLWSPVQISNPIGETLEDMVIQLGLTVINDPDSPPTFHDARGHGHWIDLSLATKPLYEAITQWSVKPDKIAVTDHELITTHIQMEQTGTGS